MSMEDYVFTARRGDAAELFRRVADEHGITHYALEKSDARRLRVRISLTETTVREFEKYFIIEPAVCG